MSGRRAKRVNLALDDIGHHRDWTSGSHYSDGITAALSLSIYYIRIIHILLMVVCMVIFCSSISIPASAIEDPVFTVSIAGAIDSGKTFNDQSTLVLSWRIQANSEGLVLSNVQGLRLAFDNTVLQLMNWVGSDTIADSGITTSYTLVPDAGMVGAYGANALVFAAKSDSNHLGYVSLSLGDVFETYDCSQGEDVLLAQIRFAFRAGKSEEDLKADSIRCQNISELNEMAQSSAVLLNTDEGDGVSYAYLRQSNGVALGGDTLNAPTVTYPGSEIGSGGDHGEFPVDVPGTSEPAAPNEPAGQDAAGQDATASPAPSADEAPTMEISPVIETSLPSESANPGETADMDDPESSPTWLYVALIGGAFLAVLFVVFLLRKSKRKGTPV